MKKFIMFIIVTLFVTNLQSQYLPIGKDWGKKGAKWHYVTGDNKRVKDSLTIVWESIADTNYEGSNCHLFVKYYVSTLNVRKTTNIDTIFMYNSVTGDTFYRWLPRLSAWTIHYAQTMTKKDTLELEAEGTPQDKSYLKVPIINVISGNNYLFGKKYYYTKGYFPAYASDDPSSEIFVIKGIGNMTFFNLEEGIYDYYYSNYSEASGWLLCYQATDTSMPIVGDTKIGCYKFISSIQTVLKEQFALKVYPQPCTDFIRLEQNGIEWSPSAMVSVMDVQGRVLSVDYQIKGNYIEVNTSSLPRGLYMCMIKGKEGIQMVKIVRE